LKISAQKDGFLCGLLGTNGLGNFYMPKKYLLIDVANIDVEHMWVLLRVVQQLGFCTCMGKLTVLPKWVTWVQVQYSILAHHIPVVLWVCTGKL
jgi:hypothetical protein